MTGRRILVTASVAATVAVCTLTITAQQLPETEIPQKLEQVRNSVRSIQRALETYRIDWNCYVGSTTDPALTAEDNKLPEGIPTFSRFQPGSAITLTSPISYIPRTPADPFTSPPAPFAYYGTPDNWLLWSPGPDGKYDLDLAEFDASQAKQSPEFIAAYSYDPTNGLMSGGDIWFDKSYVGDRGSDSSRAPVRDSQTLQPPLTQEQMMVSPQKPRITPQRTPHPDKHEELRHQLRFYQTHWRGTT